jgi:hypothetical protein
MSATTCPDCGAENEPRAAGWSYCVKCGKRLTSVATAAASAGYSRTAPREGPPEERWAGFASRGEGNSASTASGSPPAAQARAAQPVEVDLRRTTITLRGSNERVTDSLPSLCMRCGDTATLSREKKFGWYPRWVWLIAPFGGLPFLVVLLVLRKLMTVKIPLCRRHRFPWLMMKLLLTLFLVYLFVAPLALVYVSVEILGRNNSWSGPLLLGWLAGLPVIFVLIFVAARRTIHVKRITDDGMILGGVSQAFAKSLRDPARHW